MLAVDERWRDVEQAIFTRTRPGQQHARGDKRSRIRACYAGPSCLVAISITGMKAFPCLAIVREPMSTVAGLTVHMATGGKMGRSVTALAKPPLQRRGRAAKSVT